MRELKTIAEPGDVARREFLSQATLAAAAALLASCTQGGDSFAPKSANPDPGPGTSGGSLTVTVASFPALATVGGIAAVGTISFTPIAVVRTGASSYVALSRICTHAGCDISVVSGGFSCPCHGSQFDSTGAATQGPAVNALERFHVAVSGDGTTLTIS
jgi:cytochrome b6-f complex iron-sulfur subunit